MQGDFSQKLTWLSLLKLLDLPSSKYNFLGKNYLYQIFVKMPLFQWHSPIFMISIVLWRCIRRYIYLAFNIGSLFVDQVCAAVCSRSQPGLRSHLSTQILFLCILLVTLIQIIPFSLSTLRSFTFTKVQLAVMPGFTKVSLTSHSSCIRAPNTHYSNCSVTYWHHLAVAVTKSKIVLLATQQARKSGDGL